MKKEKNNLVEIQIQNEAIYTLTILSKNTEELFDQITNLVEINKNKFQHTPVILEIKSKHFQANELAVLIEVLTQNNMVVIGIRSKVQELIDFARFSGLAIFDKPITTLKKEKKPKQLSEEAKFTFAPKFIVDQDKKYNLPKIMINEIATSEQVVSKDSDLVLLGGVKANAEVISHGCIYAYKEVCGKVFAGINGDNKATIFIHSFNVELIAIAGIYKQFKIVPSKLKGHSVMINLKDDKLRFKIVK